MKALAPIWRLWCLTWYRVALAELSRKDPMHDDIPHLVMVVNSLENAR